MARQKEVNYVVASKVARFVTKALNSSERSQFEIAQEMGFKKPNIITMIKQGRIKMPINRIPAFCKATNTEAESLLNIVLEENYPDILTVLADVKGVTMSAIESDLLLEARRVKKDVESETGQHHDWKWVGSESAKSRLEKHLRSQLAAIKN